MPLDEPERCAQRTATENGLNYVFVGLDLLGDAVRLKVDRAGYGQIMRSCDYLIEEAIIAAGISSRINHTPEARWVARTVRARREIIAAGPNVLLLQPRLRAAGVSLAGATVTRVDGTVTYHYKMRSSAVGTYPNTLHVVPTGMYNGKTGFYQVINDQTTRPGRVLLTEFLEELFNASDLGGFEADEHWDTYWTHISSCWR